MNETISTDASTNKNAATNGIIAILAVVLTVTAIIWAADLPRQVGLLLYTEQFLSGMLAIAVPLVFLSIRAKRAPKDSPAQPIPWYDFIFAGLGAFCAIYMAVRYPELAELVATAPVDGLVPAVIMVFLLIEGLRRTVGTALTVLVIIFMCIGLFGHLLPGKLSGRQMAWQDLFYYLAWDPTSILGVPMKIVTSIVIAFVFFGQVLTKSGGSTFFTEISMVLVGRFRGGQAKIAVTASGFFGSISGSVVSNVVTTGVVTIPMMRNAGYRAIETLRLEKGYRAWSSDIGPDHTPDEAGLGWAVKMKSNIAFRGREAVAAQRKEGVRKVLATFTTSGDTILSGRETIYRNGVRCGWLSSGGYGHTLGHSLGIGYVRASEAIDREYVLQGTYELEVATERVSAEVTLNPLYDPGMDRVRG